MPFAPKQFSYSDKKTRVFRPDSYEERRGSSSERGYDAHWQRVRRHHLQHHPLCEDCLKEKRYTPAHHVHHIIKLKLRPDLKDDPKNLMSLCAECHNIRTARGE